MSDQTGRTSGRDFPCASLDEALPHLRRPPTPEAVHFKIQNTVGEHAQIAAYLDARLVFDRLDHVAGGRWTARFEELPKVLLPPPCDRNGQRLPRPPLHVRCRLTVLGVTRQDVGEGRTPRPRSRTRSSGPPCTSGSAAPSTRSTPPGDGELRRNSKGNLILDERTASWLREQYGRWLERRGRAQFGEPLDHSREPETSGPETRSGKPMAEVSALRRRKAA